MFKIILALALGVACGVGCGPVAVDPPAPVDCSAVPMPDECDNAKNCYVEPAEARCDYLTALPAVLAEPMYCRAPQAQPWAPYCETRALDTGTELGSQWCCWAFTPSK